MEGLPGHPVQGPGRRAGGGPARVGLLLSGSRRLVVLRHGRTADNLAGVIQGQLDTPLDDVGRTQAARVASVLAAMSPALVLSSDLVRARDTADALGLLTGLVPVVDTRLRELSLGSWEGLTSSQARERHPEEHAIWRSGGDVRRGGGETRREAGERAAACVRAHLPALAPGGLVVAVTHGGTARAALGVLLDLPDESWVRLVALGNACWSVLAEADLGWRLEQHNLGFTAGEASIEPGR